MKYPITREGYDNLKKDHEYLLNTKRPKIILAIEEARAHGDISENAEYEAAKEEYQFLQKKVGELEEMLRQCEIVDVKKSPNGVVGFGGRVSLKNLDTDEEVVYTVVGPYESDMKKGKISIELPSRSRAPRQKDRRRGDLLGAGRGTDLRDHHRFMARGRVFLVPKTANGLAGLIFPASPHPKCLRQISWSDPSTSCLKAS